MLLRRKPKNRRLGRRQVLDVKMRSSRLRALRMRFGAMALATVFGVGFGGYLAWRTGNWALNRFVYENKAFAIHRIDVQTDGVIAVDQLRRWANVKPGDNLLALDLASVKRNLELVSSIQSAAVERVLPHTLRIRVVEREPVAQAYAPRPRPGGGHDMALVYLDADGYVIQPLDPRHRSTPPAQGQEQFPTIAGIDANALQPGWRVDFAQVRAALDFIVAFERSSLAGLVDLKRIDVSFPEILQVTTDQGSEITLSAGDLERQLRRWREIHEQGQKFRRVIATLDLAVSNNIPARWVEASALPPAAPRSVKPSRTTKKKNV